MEGSEQTDGSGYDVEDEGVEPLVEHVEDSFLGSGRNTPTDDHAHNGSRRRVRWGPSTVHVIGSPPASSNAPWANISPPPPENPESNPESLAGPPEQSPPQTPPQQLSESSPVSAVRPLTAKPSTLPPLESAEQSRLSLTSSCQSIPPGPDEQSKPSPEPDVASADFADEAQRSACPDEQGWPADSGGTIPFPLLEVNQASESTGKDGMSTNSRRRARAEEIHYPRMPPPPPPVDQSKGSAIAVAKTKAKRKRVVQTDSDPGSKSNGKRPLPDGNTGSDQESDTTIIEPPAADSTRTQSKILAAGIREACNGRATAGGISLMPSFRQVSPTEIAPVASFINRKHQLSWRRHRVWQGRISTVFGRILKVRHRRRTPRTMVQEEQKPAWRKKAVCYVGKADPWTYITLKTEPRLRYIATDMSGMRFWRGVHPLTALLVIFTFRNNAPITLGRGAYDKWLRGTERGNS